MDCLVRKLKAKVNNPNLPAFETMQQFTLNAITASGNLSMTDEQKYALNHAFYLLGAIENSALWQKVDYLLLPIIGESLDYFRYDYKNSTNGLNTLNTSKFTDGHGGLEALVPEQPLTNQYVNFVNKNTRINSEKGALFVSLLSNYSEPLGVDFKINYTDNSSMHMYASNGSVHCQCGIESGHSLNARTTGTFNSLLTNVKGVPYSQSTVEGLFSTINGAIVKATNYIDNQGTYVDTTGKTIDYVRLSIYPSKPIGVVAVFGDYLTDNEASKVFEATKVLNDAFPHI